ncbi:Cas1p-domain-containing protein [Pleomassaria siparia CBS 279.74]|uniref:Cas1p-domain-containing protein n=1 Tax=Pleomassaria siparia CBS 279.74 TaxID=1314801 RepID=A0A6G1KSQ5_9PLEO|nr:Cas1p-domain-containing protein [Pleomassaria siparia CBS 279.74]
MAVPVLFLSISHCFLADRTHIFEKFTRHFSNFEFRFLIGITVVGCLFTIRNVLPTGRRRSNSSSASSIRWPFLPRVQSDEFKGWLQIYVLVYRYTHASEILDLYEVHRVFLAFYLFLSGYGHAMYLLQRRDYSLHRVAAVLIRLNLLAISLSFLMDRPYSLYYFAPLVSFWFLVTYYTLRVAEHKNASLQYMIAKLVVSAILVTCFIHVKGILEMGVYILSTACRMDISVADWRFHLGMDKYIVYMGVLAATINIRVSSILDTPPPRPKRLLRVINSHLGLIRTIFVFVALLIIPTFWTLTRRSPDEEDYNWWMPYISWLPILSFVVLRNVTQFLRSHHCAAFAWIGRKSLEIYLLSHHIWLAGDGQGLLRIGFRGDGSLVRDRWRDLLAFTAILGWVAGHVEVATRTITAGIVEVPVSENAVYYVKDRLPIAIGQQETRPNVFTNPAISAMPKSLPKRLMVIALVVWACNWAV